MKQEVGEKEGEREMEILEMEKRKVAEKRKSPKSADEEISSDKVQELAPSIP